jgi:hypothetical protein
METEKTAITCKLNSVELREREATLLAEFKASLTAVEEIAEGYRFELPGNAKFVVLVANVMASERECCPFLEFDLHTSPNRGSLVLVISGPSGTKDFVRGLFL